MTTTKPKRSQSVVLPLILLLLLTIPFTWFDNVAHDLGYDVLAKTVAALRTILGIAVWLLLAMVANRITGNLIWDGLFERRLGKPIPKLLRDMVGILFLIAAVAGIIGSVFGKSLTLLAAATGGAGFIIGLAVKEMIADVFAGLALNAERPFVLGDFIRVGEREGEVVELNWRATHLRTTDNAVVMIPNSKLATDIIVNLHRDGTHFRTDFELWLDHDLSTSRALRILNAAVKRAQVDLVATDGPYPTNLQDLESDAIALGVDATGVRYRIRYWVPEYMKWSMTRNRIIDSVMEQLTINGIRPVAPRQDIFHSGLERSVLSEEQRRRNVIRKTEFFQALTDGEVESLSAQLKLKSIAPGQDVVTRGQQGDSMYFILEGLLDVYIWIAAQSKEIRVANMTTGRAFGEMSMLTGEPRSATIRARTDALVYEMTKDDLTTLLHQRPQVAEQISAVMAGHQLRDAKNRERLSAEEQREQTENFAAAILSKIKDFFSI